MIKTEKTADTGRGGILEALLSLGFITPEETEKYKALPEELPSDKKELILYYTLSDIICNTADLCRGLPETLSVIPKTGITNRRVIDAYDIRGEEFSRRIRDLRVKNRYEIFKTFVGAYRNRVRDILLPYMRIDVAGSLSLGKATKEEDEPNPLLWEIVKEAGYRERAKSLNETDRAAIETAAQYFLNLIELGFLNGEIEAAEQRRTDVPTDSEGNTTEYFAYTNDYDETLWGYGNIVYLWEEAVFQTLQGNCITELKQIASYSFFGGDGVEEYPVIERLRNTKFKVYVEEVEKC